MNELISKACLDFLPAWDVFFFVLFIVFFHILGYVVLDQKCFFIVIYIGKYLSLIMARVYHFGVQMGNIAWMSSRTSSPLRWSY